jgi:hypothetical protein
LDFSDRASRQSPVNPKSRTASCGDGRCDCHATALIFDDFFDDRESNACIAFVYSRQGLKNLKYPFLVFWRDTDAIIGNSKFPAVVLGLRGDTNIAASAIVVFVGIGNEIGQNSL